MKNKRIDCPPVGKLPKVTEDEDVVLLGYYKVYSPHNRWLETDIKILQGLKPKTAEDSNKFGYDKIDWTK